MFVAVARIPAHPKAIEEAARIAELAVADVSRRLVGVLPRVLLPATEAGDRIVADLEAIGFVAFTGSAADIPAEKDRVIARDLEWVEAGFVVSDARGQRHECPASSISLIQRGVRIIEQSELVKTTERKLDVGRALLTGGLVLTRKVEKTALQTESNKEAFALIQRGDGRPAIILPERGVHYACLGAQIQPASFGNFMTLLGRIRAMAPQAPFDDRTSRPGFVANLPLMATDPVDLALFLVDQARRRGC